MKSGRLKVGQALADATDGRTRTDGLVRWFQESWYATRGKWPYRPAATRTASEVKYDLGCEISDLNYPSIHVHISYTGIGPFGGLWGRYSHQTALEVKSEISDLNYLHIQVHIAYTGIDPFSDGF